MRTDDLERRLRAELPLRATEVDTSAALVGPAVLRAHSIRRRRRLVAVAAVIGALAILAPAVASVGGRLDSAPPAGPRGRPVPLAPLCGTPAWQGRLAPPFHDTATACPSTTPAGRYRSALVGYQDVQLFSFTLPDGWRVTAVPGRIPGRLDVAGSRGWMLRARGTDVGLSLLVSPARADGTRIDDLTSWTGLLESRYGVDASPITETTIAGLPAQQVDLRPTTEADLVRDCPVGRRCLPVLRAPDDPLVLAALMPRTTSRLIVTKPSAPVIGYPLVIWLWDLDGEGDGRASADAVRQVLDSIAFFARAMTLAP